RSLAGQLVEQRDRLVAGPRGRDLALVAEARAELGAQHAQHAFLVVHTDDHFAPAHALPISPASLADVVVGSRTSNTVRPGVDSQRSSPPCLSTICRAMPRPRPVPSPFAFVVKNGSKIRGTTSAGGAGPVPIAPASLADVGVGSRTSNTVRPGVDSQRSSPPCLSTICRAMPRPRPVPSPFAFVVKNGSKIRGTTSAGTPGPLSITRTTAESG